jgi:hypothetical protein
MPTRPWFLVGLAVLVMLSGNSCGSKPANETLETLPPTITSVGYEALEYDERLFQYYGVRMVLRNEGGTWIQSATRNDVPRPPAPPAVIEKPKDGFDEKPVEVTPPPAPAPVEAGSLAARRGADNLSVPNFSWKEFTDSLQTMNVLAMGKGKEVLSSSSSIHVPRVRIEIRTSDKKTLVIDSDRHSEDARFRNLSETLRTIAMQGASRIPPTAELLPPVAYSKREKLPLQ